MTKVMMTMRALTAMLTLMVMMMIIFMVMMSDQPSAFYLQPSSSGPIPSSSERRPPTVYLCPRLEPSTNFNQKIDVNAT